MPETTNGRELRLPGGWRLAPVVVRTEWAGHPATVSCRGLISPNGRHWWQQMERVPAWNRAFVVETN